MILKPFLSLQVPSAIGCGTLTAGPAGQTSPSPGLASAAAVSSPSWVLTEKTRCRSFWERKMLPFLSERGGERLGRGCRAQAHGSILPHCATFQSLSPRVYPRTLLPCSLGCLRKVPIPLLPCHAAFPVVTFARVSGVS